MLRTFLTFEANFPDDCEFTAGGDVSRPGGQNIATAIAGLLSRQGWPTTAPIQHSFYGWAFTAGEAHEFGFLIQDAGPWLLQCEDQGTRQDERKQRDVLSALNDELASDDRFRELNWFTKRDYEARRAGAQTP